MLKQICCAFPPALAEQQRVFLTVCKIELDTVGNLTSRQPRIFFTPQVLVFLGYFLFSQLELPLDIVSVSFISISTISALLPPPPPPPPPPHFLLPSAQHSPRHQRRSDTRSLGQDFNTAAQQTQGMRTARTVCPQEGACIHRKWHVGTGPCVK